VISLDLHFTRDILQATLAFDVIQQKEVTKQLEHGTRQAAYEMQARQYEISRVKDEGDEARRTLIVSIGVGLDGYDVE